jgi:hypothetical protein
MGNNVPHFFWRFFMNRSNIKLFTILAFIIEMIILIVEFNEKYRFVNSTLEFKYWLTCTVLYVALTVLSIFFVAVTSDNSAQEVRRMYLEILGTEHVNFMYTYHFIFFAALCFYLSAWPWCIMGIILFWAHNYVHRDNQNKYALEYEIEAAKIEARKPVIINPSEELL